MYSGMYSVFIKIFTNEDSQTKPRASGTWYCSSCCTCIHMCIVYPWLTYSTRIHIFIATLL